MTPSVTFLAAEQLTDPSGRATASVIQKLNAITQGLKAQGIYATIEYVNAQIAAVAPGLVGPAGAGVATGGSTGQVLKKNSGADYDTGWVSLGSLAYLSTINGGNWSGLDLAIADGGTGASSAAAARLNLDLYSVGETNTAISTALSPYLLSTTAATTYQPLDGDLTSLAAASATGALYYRSAANTWSTVTIGSGVSFAAGTLSATGSGGTVTSVGLTSTDFTISGSPVTGSGNITANLATQAGITAASYGSASQTVTATVNSKGVLTGLAAQAIAIGWSAITSGKPTTLAGYGITDAQPLATPLTALAGVTPAADTFAYFTSGTTATTAALTAQGRALLDDNTAADNRVTIGLDQRTGVGDADYSILATDRTVATTVAFTAARTWTLPAASSINAGQVVVVSDDFGTVTATNTLTVQRAGADGLNGGSSVVLSRPYRTVTFVSDGISKWTYDAQVQLLDTANTWRAAQNVVISGGGALGLNYQGEGAVAVSAQRASSNSISAGFSCVKYRGTLASPTVVALNDDLGLLGFRGHDGAAVRVGAQLTATCVAPTPSSANFYTRLILTACASGSGTATELARWDHATGFSLYGTQVVGARQTGFAAATGTASKVTYATYTAGTAGVTYTATDTQGLMNHVQVLSQQVKALKDALLAHGLIGT